MNHYLYCEYCGSKNILHAATTFFHLHRYVCQDCKIEVYIQKYPWEF
jgi:DNA-directed RNA polymerase subunit RPC12/RpoP